MTDREEFEKAYFQISGKREGSEKYWFKRWPEGRYTFSVIEEAWEVWQAARATDAEPVKKDAIDALSRYRKAYGEIYTALGQFLDEHAGESAMTEGDVESAWQSFNSAPGPVFWQRIENALALPAGSQGVPEGQVMLPREFLQEYLELLDGAQYKEIHKLIRRNAVNALLSTSPGNGWVRCEDIEPDAFWDADNSEQNYSDPFDLADYASQDLRQGETMTVTVLCAKELPKRTMKIWINSDDEAEFDWISESQTTGESK